MRASMLALGAGLLIAASGARAEEAPPKVSKVLVYPDAAMVTRAVDVMCTGDVVTARFPGLPPAMSPDTVRATASGSGTRIEGVTVNERIRERPYSAELEALDKQIETAQDKLTAIQRQVERAAAAHQRGVTLWQTAVPFITREAAVQARPNTTAWAVALDQGRVVQQEADASRRAAESERREVQRQLDDLQRRRNELASAAPTRAFDAEVVLHCPGGRTLVELSYMTTAARWSPAYEARADIPANSIDLSVLADVTQWTGESWEDVAVTLSTAQSRRDAQPPKLQRLYVGQQPKEETKKVLVRRDEAAQHVSGPMAGNVVGGEVEAADQGVSVQLTVPGKSDLLGDGRPARLLVQRLGLPASFSLVTTPKLLPHVLNRGHASNAAKFPLLPGPVGLFSRGAFLGTTRLERVAEGDTVKLAFGLNEQVQVKRSVLSEQKVDPGFLGSTRRLKYGYRIELISSASKAQTIELQEQIPVSELDDVKVLLDKETTPGYSQVASDGLLTWPVTLGPGEKKVVELHFTVEIPSKYDSAGL